MAPPTIEKEIDVMVRLDCKQLLGMLDNDRSAAGRSVEEPLGVEADLHLKVPVVLEERPMPLQTELSFNQRSPACRVYGDAIRECCRDCCRKGS